MDKLNGGKMIATGSSSCVIHPNIKCLNNTHKKRDKKKVSKIVFGEKASEYTHREKYINDTVKRIPGHKDWALIFDDICKPPAFKESISIDKGITECFDGEDTALLHSGMESKKVSLFNENSIMLIGDFGGDTLGNYFKKKLKIDNSKYIKDLEKEFLSLMKKFKNLFIGLVELNKYKIIHLDIKHNNIVTFKGNFKFIDFGLSNLSSNKEHFLKRSYNEFNTKRIYLLYPLEYIYFNISEEEINLELEKIKVIGFDEFRNLTDIYISINDRFSRNAKDDLISILNDYKTLDYDSFIKNDYTDLINGIDTYSFGMLMPILFYSNDILKYVDNSKLLSDFFDLFKMMCEPYYKNRVHIKDAYDIFLKLLEKYNANDKKSRKRKTSKSKKRQSRKSKTRKIRKSKTRKGIRSKIN